MDPLGWSVDWNPDFEDEPAIRREVARALQDERLTMAIRRLAEQAVAEALDDGLETEHLVWLDTRGNYAFFVRVWFEASEEKVFIIIEENDLGDVGFLMLEGLECATYGTNSVLKVEFRDPETLGVSR
ncbi:MAG: hypothetical protein R3185_02140 [Candidatus Thermoplasmatota archaeon]|nr:hypothetical protein [Candidatus Thermoplasmatota archaeon]